MLFHNNLKQSKHIVLIFSSDVVTNKRLTNITSESIRDDLVKIIESLKADGGTCLGDGLKNGMDVSSNLNDLKIFKYIC